MPKKYIDTDELMRDINDSLNEMTRIGIAVDVDWLWAKLNDAIANATTADVVPVVRCKDCKWWDKKDDSPYGYCHAAKHAYYSSHWEIGIYRTYKPDWFCADGERKDDDG